jgi:hypothetical protein
LEQMISTILGITRDEKTKDKKAPFKSRLTKFTKLG